MKLNLVIFVLILSMLFVDVNAVADCDPNDGNNTEVDAITIGVDETVTGVVCPDDPFDFYKIVIPESAIVSGSVSFSSPQDATVLRVYNKATSTNIINDLSTTSKNSYSVTFDAGTITPGTYYCRVYHWSEADYDHEYTLTLDLKINVPRSSGAGGFGNSEVPVIMKTPGSLTLPVPPWPSENGNADHGRCSRAAGPGANMVESVSLDLFGEILSWEEYHSSGIPFMEGQTLTHVLKDVERKDGFHSLLVDSRNILYVTIKPEDHGVITFAYDLDHGQRWYADTVSDGTLGRSGRLYYVKNFGLGGAVIALDSAGNELWKNGIPDAGKMATMCAVGKNIYIDGGWIGDSWDPDGENYASAFKLNGDVKWTAEPIINRIHGMAEDSVGNLYVRDEKEGLHKISQNGETLWSIVMPSHKFSSEAAGAQLGPITGVDGRIWTSTMLASYPGEGIQYVPGATPGSTIKVVTLANGPVYVVTNPDGSQHKYGTLGDDAQRPRFACYGANGMLCLASADNTVSGFSDWDEQEWNWQMGGTEKIVDMVMDKNNILYVLFRAWGIQSMGVATYIAVVDSSTGAQLSFARVDVPEEWGAVNGELAIGDGGVLIYLNGAGYLKVFHRQLRFKPGAMREPEKIQFERF